MDANSPKPVETGNAQVLALQLTLEWLDREGGQQRNPRILRAVLESTLTAVSRGDPPPEKDTATLRDLMAQIDGDNTGRSPKPFRAAELSNWWQSREEQVRQLCRRRGCPWTPRLVVRTGGGRGVTSSLSFEFRPTNDVEDAEATDSAEAGCTTAAPVVRYQMDPARPALWLRVLVGSRPFPVRSWRGLVLLGAVALNFGLIGLIWLVTWVSLTGTDEITTRTLALLGVAALVSTMLWWQSKPVWQLPSQRVTLAGPAFLAMDELHGQLRTMPTPGHALKSREFAVVRHWGICPICSAEVDLDSGRNAFPDRLIGRCHDAPLEHVFSFDPVRLEGHPLRSLSPVKSHNGTSR